MDEVHKSHNLYNDISPDNILLYFPEEESKVYIGVCDWGLATKPMEPMKSLYTFRDKKSKDEKIGGRWWVNPTINTKFANFALICMYQFFKFLKNSRKKKLPSFEHSFMYAPTTC